MKVKQTIATILTGILVSVSLVGCQSTQEEWDNPVIRDGRSSEQMTEEQKADAREKLQDKESDQDCLNYLEDYIVDIQNDGIHCKDLDKYYYPTDEYTLAQFIKEVNMIDNPTEAQTAMVNMIDANVRNTRVIKVENMKWKNEYEVQVTMTVEHPDFDYVMAQHAADPEGTDEEKIAKCNAIIDDMLNNYAYTKETISISMVNPMLMVKNGVDIKTSDYKDEWLLNETEFMEHMFFMNNETLCN